MTDATKTAVTAHYDGEVDVYTNMYDKDFLDRTGEYPSNYVRLGILSNRLAQFGAKRVFEVGMGEGTPLLTWSQMGIEVAGCDLSRPMVDATRARFSRVGINEPIFFVGDAEDAKTLTPAGFIPDPKEGGATSAAEGVAVDSKGIVYGAEVGPRALKRYEKQ